MYAIDRALFHLTASPAIRRVAGIRLGRVNDVKPNDPDFGEDEETIVRVLVRTLRNPLSRPRRHRP